MTVIFDDAGHAREAGNIRVFHYVTETGEYWTWSDEYIPVGVSIPGSSTLIDPGEDIVGHVWVFDGSAWVSKEDHRGETVYFIDNGASSVVAYIGAINDEVTTLAPTTAYDKWDGTQWVTDTDAQHAEDISTAVLKKEQLLAEATSEIGWLQYAVDNGIATDNEMALLDKWQLYRVHLKRVDVGNAPNIEWPHQ
ncbi:tail fiber assembly protein [Kluyvera cryocrescens]|uniref:tail fiber assembly protein n=1 Tax=Kluyvera cryocrescens TaxID=580 RepID=UPI0039F67136